MEGGSISVHQYLVFGHMGRVPVYCFAQTSLQMTADVAMPIPNGRFQNNLCSMKRKFRNLLILLPGIALPYRPPVAVCIQLMRRLGILRIVYWSCHISVVWHTYECCKISLWHVTRMKLPVWTSKFNMSKNRFLWRPFANMSNWKIAPPVWMLQFVKEVLQFHLSTLTF